MSASLREQYGTARAFVLLSAGRARVGVEKALCLGRRFRARLVVLGLLALANELGSTADALGWSCITMERR